MAIRRGRFVRIARPSSSTESKRFPLGFRARRCMFLRCANGRVCDLLLQVMLSLWFYPSERRDMSYFTRSKTDTLLPTGERRHVPSGEKTRFPLANTVPSKLLNWTCQQLTVLWIGHITWKSVFMIYLCSSMSLLMSDAELLCAWKMETD